MDNHRFYKLKKERQASFKGKVFSTNHSGDIKVVEYHNALKIEVEFINTGSKRFTTMNYIRSGVIKDRSIPHIKLDGNYPITLGDGFHTFSSQNEAYTTWVSMLKRCYLLSRLDYNPTYRGCSVTPEWFNFQNFANWYIRQHKQAGWQLDKDIIIKGNKIYSPDYCCLVPPQINSLFIKCNKSRGHYPIGVSKKKDVGNKPYIAVCNNAKGVSKHLGRFHTSQEAFIAYKECKEQVVKSIAEEFKGLIDPKVYDAMIRYQVEISD